MDTMIINQQDKIPYDKELQKVILKIVRSAEKIIRLPANTELSIMLVDDVYIQDLNLMYRQQNCPTDVLSFAMNEMTADEPGYDDEEEINVLGDIVISLETALAQSVEYGHSLQRELGFLVAHGILHLLGYNHESESETEAMESLQERILKMAKLER
ncbi:MAG: rRNA maturation RNase YbeY [Syntrophomonadaceae bacterium]|nr:rRNA maturation RNase YbeY [Syntrophomonadaceae bacterium]